LNEKKCTIFNSGLKIGVDKFYTTISYAYSPIEETFNKSSALGFGFGSIISINALLFINPEIDSINRLGTNNPMILSFIPNFGFNINKHIALTMGPALTMVYYFGEESIQKPFFSIFQHNITEKSSIITGARIGEYIKDEKEKKILLEIIKKEKK
jgi:hypothetical protein